MNNNILIVVLLATNFTESQNTVKPVVIHCDEKFTEYTNRNYTNDSGCLIERQRYWGDREFFF